MVTEVDVEGEKANCGEEFAAKRTQLVGLAFRSYGNQ